MGATNTSLNGHQEYSSSLSTTLDALSASRKARCTALKPFLNLPRSEILDGFCIGVSDLARPLGVDVNAWSGLLSCLHAFYIPLVFNRPLARVQVKLKYVLTVAPMRCTFL